MPTSGSKITYVTNGLRGLRKLCKALEPYQKLEDKDTQRELCDGEGWEEPDISLHFDQSAPRCRQRSVDDKLSVLTPRSKDQARSKKPGWRLCSIGTPGESVPIRGRSFSSRAPGAEPDASSVRRWSSPSPRTSELPSCFPCRTPRRGRSAYQAAAERQRSRRLGSKAAGDQTPRAAAIANCRGLTSTSSSAKSDEQSGQNHKDEAGTTTGGCEAADASSLAVAPAPQEVPSPTLLFTSTPVAAAELASQSALPVHARRILEERRAHESTSPSATCCNQSARIRHASAHAELGSRALGYRQLIDTPSSQDSPRSSLAVTPLDSLSWSQSPSLLLGTLTPLDSLSWSRSPQQLAGSATPSASGEAKLQEAQLLLAEMLSRPGSRPRRSSKSRHHRPVSAPPAPSMQRVPECSQAELETGSQEVTEATPSCLEPAGQHEADSTQAEPEEGEHQVTHRKPLRPIPPVPSVQNGHASAQGGLETFSQLGTREAPLRPISPVPNLHRAPEGESDKAGQQGKKESPLRPIPSVPSFKPAAECARADLQIGSQQGTQIRPLPPIPPVPSAQRKPECAQDQMEKDGQQGAQIKTLRPINGAMPWFPAAELSEPSNAEPRELSLSTKPSTRDKTESGSGAGLPTKLETDASGLPLLSAAQQPQELDALETIVHLQPPSYAQTGVTSSIPSKLETVISGLPLLAAAEQHLVTDITETIVHLQPPNYLHTGVACSPSSKLGTVAARSPALASPEQPPWPSSVETIADLPSLSCRHTGVEFSDMEFCELLKDRLGEPPTPSPLRENASGGEDAFQLRDMAGQRVPCTGDVSASLTHAGDVAAMQACVEDQEFCKLLAGRLNSPVIFSESSPAAAAVVTNEISTPPKPAASYGDVIESVPFNISSNDARTRARRIIDAAKAGAPHGEALQSGKVLEILMALREDFGVQINQARRLEKPGIDSGMELSVTPAKSFSVNMDKPVDQDAYETSGAREVPRRRLCDFRQVMAERRALYSG